MGIGRAWTGGSRIATVVASRVGIDALLGVSMHVDGLDRLPREGMVVAFNHLSAVDPFVLAHLLAADGRPDPVVLLHGAGARIPLVSRLLEAGAIQVEDDTSDEIARDEAGEAGMPDEASEAFALARRLVADGHPVLIAPERGVSPSLELMPLRSGAAALAVATGAPLVPAGMFGTNRLFEGDRFVRLRRTTPVTVSFGHPVMVGATVRQTTRMLHLDMEALLERVLDDYPDREEGEDGAVWWPARRGGDAPSLATVIDARASQQPVAGDVGADDPIAAEVWTDAVEDVPPVEPSPAPPEREPPVPVAAMGHDEILEQYPRSYHRNAAQRGGYLRDLKGVVAYDLPGQPHENHPVVHLDHHVDGRLTIFTDVDAIRLAEVDLAASAVRVVVYGRVDAPHDVVTPGGPVTVPAGTLVTFLGVPQDRTAPLPITDWEHVRSIHMQA